MALNNLENVWLSVRSTECRVSPEMRQGCMEGGRHISIAHVAHVAHVPRNSLCDSAIGFGPLWSSVSIPNFGSFGNENGASGNNYYHLRLDDNFGHTQPYTTNIIVPA